MPIEFTCPHCGRRTSVQDQYIGQTGPCAGCGRTVTVLLPGSVPFQPIGENAAIRMLLPVGRSPWAIAAGYAGLVSVLPIFAPFALLFGILAIRDIRRHPGTHGMGRAVFGLVMGGIFTILLVFIIAMCVVSGLK